MLITNLLHGCWYVFSSYAHTHSTWQCYTARPGKFAGSRWRAFANPGIVSVESVTLDSAQVARSSVGRRRRAGRRGPSSFSLSPAVVGLAYMFGLGQLPGLFGTPLGRSERSTPELKCLGRLVERHCTWQPRSLRRPWVGTCSCW